MRIVYEDTKSGLIHIVAMSYVIVGMLQIPTPSVVILTESCKLIELSSIVVMLTTAGRRLDQ